jgi:heat shock protein HslJ
MADIAASFVGRAFRVVEIERVPALDEPVADLTFGDDGRVTGCATINRLFGPYVLDGDQLTAGPLAGTMMAGPPEAMDQEQRLHRALSAPLTVVVDESGDRVELRRDAGVAVVLVPDDRVELI